MDLEKFSAEIEKAAPPAPGGPDPLKGINKAEIEKIAELSMVAAYWDQHSYVKSVSYIG